MQGLKRATDEFENRFEALKRDPTNPQLIADCNVLGDLIQQYQAGVASGLRFDPLAATDNRLAALLANWEALDPRSKLLAAPELAMTIAAFASNNLRDPARSLVAQSVNEANELLATDPAAGIGLLETLAQCLTGQARDVALGNVDALNAAIATGDVTTVRQVVPRLFLADRLSRALLGERPEPREVEVQVRSALASSPRNLMDQLRGLAGQFNDLIIASDDIIAKVPDEEVQDRVGEGLTEVTRLSESLVGELRRYVPGSLARVGRLVAQVRVRSLDIAGLAAATAGRRANVAADITVDLQDEIARLMENLEQLSAASAAIETAPDRNKQVRVVSKVTREIVRSLDLLRDLTDEIGEAPPSTRPPAADDFRRQSNELMAEVSRLGHLAEEQNPVVRDKRLQQIKGIIRPKLQTFKTTVKRLSAGKPESDDISRLISGLDNMLSGLSGPSALTPALARESAVLVSNVCRSVGQALSTDAVPQPESAAQLPFRFSVPTFVVSEPGQIVALKQTVDSGVKVAAGTLDSFLRTLRNPKSTGKIIHLQLGEFHKSLQGLLGPADQMRAATWQPGSQQQLSEAYTGIVAIGDAAIEAARTRLLAGDGWREAVDGFADQGLGALHALTAASTAAVQAAQADLAATNEAERELVRAARTVIESQQKFARLKTVAIERRLTAGEGYIGSDLLEIGTPILSVTASLVDAAQQQTKFLLRKDAKAIPNQTIVALSTKGLTDAVGTFVASAEAAVEGKEGSLARVLEGCGSMNSALAKFGTQAQQKTGSPELNSLIVKVTDSAQGLVKQLKTLAESGQKAKQQAPSPQTTVAARQRAPDRILAMLEAEAKVVDARRTLDLAEIRLREIKEAKGGAPP